MRLNNTIMVGSIPSCSLNIRARNNDIEHNTKYSIKLKEIHSKFIYQTPPMLIHRDRATCVKRYATTFWSSQSVLLGCFTQFLIMFIRPMLLESLPLSITEPNRLLIMLPCFAKEVSQACNASVFKIPSYTILMDRIPSKPLLQC